MKPIHSYIVTTNLPPDLIKLKEIIYNYYWAWHSDARELFVRIDRKLWEEVNHNPVELLNKLPQDKLQKLSQQADFVNYLDYIYEKYSQYMKSDTWYSKTFNQNTTIAYFSPEYGINESFPNYSGGLGMLSGDHMKSASDLGLPLVGVGLLYQQGYFRQYLSNNGWQNETYNYNNFYTMPLQLVRDDSGNPITISVRMPIGEVYCYIWRMLVGRVQMLFLDTNIPENKSDQIKNITDALYGGDRETRIQQEVILGIGGMRALDKLNLFPQIVHINEGHAAFALLERTSMLMKKHNLSFHSAKNISAASSVFTTHTPVPAGNEAFDIPKVDAYLNAYYGLFGMNKEQFIGLGQIGKYNPNVSFSMTVLGLRMTAYRNGVSKIHGRVARNMWKDLWNDFPVDEVPISSITNGIHTSTWVARELAELYDRYLSPNWRYLADETDWSKVHEIPSEELWREKQRRRVRLVLFARNYMQQRSKHSNPLNISSFSDLLDPDTLTIGFARRFATYKRANLLFRNMDRLKKIVTNPQFPVQIIIAGKAHPQDTQGKEVIQRIIHDIKEYGLEKHIIFLEDYDMVVARMMVKGCDVWLNNPIRPLEASGTSGMKAALNGTLNLSILDGWWDEAYDGTNGFAIGDGEEHENTDEINAVEAEMIYDLLETVIVPKFYDRSANTGTLNAIRQGMDMPAIRGVPEEWVKMMKNCIQTCAPAFSTSRMVKEYTVRFYIPALQGFLSLTENNGDKAKQLEDWKNNVQKEWNTVNVTADCPIPQMPPQPQGLTHTIELSQQVPVVCSVKLGKLTPEDVSVEAYFGKLAHDGEIISPHTKLLTSYRQNGDAYEYSGDIVFHESGLQGFTIRVIPNNSLLTASADMFMCKWAANV